MIKELTIGSLGSWFSFWQICWISFDGEKLQIKTLFRKWELPARSIDKLASVKFFGGECLEFFHSASGGPKQIVLNSTNPKGWFEEFEIAGIKTEDAQNLKNSSMAFLVVLKDY